MSKYIASEKIKMHAECMLIMNFILKLIKILIFQIRIQEIHRSAEFDRGIPFFKLASTIRSSRRPLVKLTSKISL